MKLKLQLDIEYQLNGEKKKTLETLLERAIWYLFDHGLITDDTAAEVKSYNLKIKETMD